MGELHGSFTFVFDFRCAGTVADVSMRVCSAAASFFAMTPRRCATSWRCPEKGAATLRVCFFLCSLLLGCTCLVLSGCCGNSDVEQHLTAFVPASSGFGVSIDSVDCMGTPSSFSALLRT